METTASIENILEVVERLNDTGRWIVLQQCMALAKHEMYQKPQPGEERDAWMGYFQSVKTEGNIVFPKWG